MAKEAEFGVGKEFPTEWHRDRFLDDLKRELQGAELRGQDDYAANVKAEIKRVEKQTAKAAPKPAAAAAEKRPADGAAEKETR